MFFIKSEPAASCDGVVINKVFRIGDDESELYGSDGVPVVGGDGQVQQQQFVLQGAKLLQSDALRDTNREVLVLVLVLVGPLGARRRVAYLPLLQPLNRLLCRPITDQILVTSSREMKRKATETRWQTVIRLHCNQITLYSDLGFRSSGV